MGYLTPPKPRYAPFAMLNLGRREKVNEEESAQQFEVKGVMVQRRLAAEPFAPTVLGGSTRPSGRHRPEMLRTSRRWPESWAQ